MHIAFLRSISSFHCLTCMPCSKINIYYSLIICMLFTISVPPHRSCTRIITFISVISHSRFLFSPIHSFDTRTLSHHQFHDALRCERLSYENAVYMRTFEQLSYAMKETKYYSAVIRYRISYKTRIVRKPSSDGFGCMCA